AEPLLRHALEGVATSAGQDHPAHAGIRFHLALLCAGHRREAEALDLLSGLTEQDTQQLPHLLCLGGERARAFHGQSVQDSYDAYLALAVPRCRNRGPGESVPSSLISAGLYDLVLKRKRLGLELLAATPLGVWQAKYPERAQELRRLWLLDRQIAVK